MAMSMNTLKVFKATSARTGAKIGDIFTKPFTFFRELRKEKLRFFCHDYGLLHDDVMYQGADPVFNEAMQRIHPAYSEMRQRRCLRATDLQFKGYILPPQMHGVQGDPLDPKLMYVRDQYFKVKQEFRERERWEDMFKGNTMNSSWGTAPFCSGLLNEPGVFGSPYGH